MASLSETSIKRPVLSIVMSVSIIVFGLIGYSYLGIREYPSVDPPVVTVQTSYTGANADIIESQITEPLEESINGIAGIKTLSSSSRDGRSNITVEFDLAVNIEDAATKNQRLMLTWFTNIILEKSLWLLGIEAPEKM
jgi:multidrug efflux pump